MEMPQEFITDMEYVLEQWIAQAPGFSLEQVIAQSWALAQMHPEFCPLSSEPGWDYEDAREISSVNVGFEPDLVCLTMPEVGMDPEYINCIVEIAAFETEGFTVKSATGKIDFISDQAREDPDEGIRVF